MKTIPSLAAASLAICFAASAANAATFDLWRDNGTLTTTSFSFMEDGISLEITGGTYDGGDAPLAGLTFEDSVRQAGAGMGVRREDDNTQQVDGLGAFEFLRFVFSTKVAIQSIIFTHVDDNDNFDMGVDGVDLDVAATLGSDLLIDFDPVTLPNANSTSGYSVAFMSAVMGQTFDFYPNAPGDNFMIARIVVEPVPLPAGLPMLLAGTGLLALIARRRTAH